MHRCNKCGHHHIQGKTSVTCFGVVYDDEGGISRCHCTHTNEQENQCAA